MEFKIELNTIVLGVNLLDGEQIIWIQQINGEGMQINEAELEKLLQEYYKDNF